MSLVPYVVKQTSRGERSYDIYSRLLEERMNQRESVFASKGDRNYITVCDEVQEEFQHQAIVPIICEGDVIGAVLLLETDQRNRMGEVEQKLLQSAATFLGRQMEINGDRSLTLPWR